MKQLTFIFILMIAIFGCGKKTLYNMPAVEQTGYYETAWIDPTVVLEDEWYTLMRSDHVDSFYVETKPGENLKMAPAIEFQVSQFECLAYVNLMNGRQELIRPLLVKKLKFGYYKLTFNIGRLKREEMPAGDYFLKAEYCGFTVIADLGRL